MNPSVTARCGSLLPSLSADVHSSSDDAIAFEGPAAAAANASHHGVNKTNGQLFADIGVWPPAKAGEDPPGT